MIADGGTLQLGIGALGDAVARALDLRQRRNAEFRDLVGRLGAADGPAWMTHTAPFELGLYGASEMFVEGFLDLYRAGVLRREVDGALLLAGFFVGSRAFYRALRDMPEAERARFRMTSISYINELYGDEAAKRRARVNARFVNAAMMATLLGAVVSDGLEDGRVVSGVGGQYNFVAQSFALPDARSIIMVRATRTAGTRTTSNILWSYGHETVPRHLRDVVVTEYGVADLRGKTDRDVVAAMLAVADSRFQGRAAAHRQACRQDRRGQATSFRPNVATTFPTGSSVLSGRRGMKACWRPFPSAPISPRSSSGCCPRCRRSRQRRARRLRLARLAMPRGLLAGAGPWIRRIDEAGLARMGHDQPSGVSERILATLVKGALA